MRGLALCFQVLAEKVHVKALSIAQRVTLLEQGLHDSSGSVCVLHYMTL